MLKRSQDLEAGDRIHVSREKVTTVTDVERTDSHVFVNTDNSGRMPVPHDVNFPTVD
jgi:hypothetical protein